MNTKQKKSLYESIMKNVSKTIKKQLNESTYKTTDAVEIEFEANVSIKLTNTKITWFDNSNQLNTDDAYKVYIDMQGNHRFCIKGGIIPMNRIKSVTYNKD